MKDLPKKVYIIGIEGGGTSALACLYHDFGVEVSGSDNGDHFFNSVLERRGIKVFEKFSPDNITKDVDLIVFSSAFTAETNSELAFALESKKEVLSYAQALARIFNQKKGLAIAGSHGKTTTTAWLGYVLKMADLKPSVLAGSFIPQLDGSSLAGDSDIFVLEADEYQNKLQYYNPEKTILLNVDYDHPDFFQSKEDYESAFADFANKIQTSGLLVANYDDEIVEKIAQECFCKVVSYSLENADADYIAEDIKSDSSGQSFVVKKKNSSESRDDLGVWNIKLFGKHNVSNALAVIAMAREIGLEFEEIKKHLANFAGTARRLEYIGEFNNVPIIDDFGHHPTEIKSTIFALRELYPDKEPVVVFHPHTFSRTKALFNDFVNCFSGLKNVIVLDIYGSAREERGTVDSKDLVEKMNLANDGMEAKHIPTLVEAEKYLRNNLKTGDVLLLLGAGDVFKIGKNLIGDW